MRVDQTGDFGFFLHNEATRNRIADSYLPAGKDELKTPAKGKPQQSREPSLPKNPMKIPDPVSGTDPVFPPMPTPSLISQTQPPMPGEVPAGLAPGINGKPPMPMLPSMPKMPTMPKPPSRNSAPPSPGLKSPLSPKAPKPVSSPSLKSPSQTKPPPLGKPPSSGKSPSAPSAPSMSMRASMDYLNTTADDDSSWGGHPMLSDPNWGSGDGSSHEGQPYGVQAPDLGIGEPSNPAPGVVSGPRTADASWGGHPMLDDNWASRKGYLFHRLSLKK
jgi:hypothetical protein